MKKRLLCYIMNTRLYAYLLLKVIPYIRFTCYYATLRGWKYLRGYAILELGDIILTLDRKKLTTLLIPGEFSHAALCVGKGTEFEIAEMTHTNFTKSTFFDICKEADRIIIGRCYSWDKDYIDKVISRCVSMSGATYDVTFKLGVKELYCSELVYESDFEHRLHCNLDDIQGLGRQYISPMGIYKAILRNGYIAWDSDKEIL